jgi:hypothetical protein
MWWEASGWHPVEEPTWSEQSGPWQATRRWPDPLAGPYLLRYWYEVVTGQPAIVGAELWGRSPVERPWPFKDELRAEMGPTSPLKAELTRLRIPELLEGVVQHNASLRAALRKSWQEASVADSAKTEAIAEQKGLDKANPGADAAERLTMRHALNEAPERTGRGRTPPDILREVGRICREATMKGEPYAAAVVEYFANRGVQITESTARTWKRKAQSAGHYHAPDSERTGK